jgi:hypothetical protein
MATTAQTKRLNSFKLAYYRLPAKTFLPNSTTLDIPTTLTNIRTKQQIISNALNLLRQIPRPSAAILTELRRWKNRQHDMRILRRHLTAPADLDQAPTLLQQLLEDDEFPPTSQAPTLSPWYDELD